MWSKRGCALGFAAAVLAQGASIAVRAQVVTGEIDGTIRDNSGAVVPHAAVVLTNTDEKLVVRTLETDANGQFSAPLLPVGSYSIKVTVPGFKVFTVSGLAVHVGAPAVVPVTLQVGSENDTIDVTASSLSIQLDTAAAGTLIDQHETTDLPLSSRNFLQLMQIQPGIATNVPGPDSRGNITTTGAVNTQNFSVNGSATSANGYFLDGADILKRAGQQPVTFASIDFIQEINLQRANYGAEFGGPGAAFVSVQTKAGTAQIHGGAYEFYEDKIFNANNYFSNLAGTPRPGARQNDYGYFVGGPVPIPRISPLHSPKTFFFFGQEFLRQEASTPQSISNIPTLAQRSGNFGSTPVCQTYNAAGTTCTTPVRQITTIDPVAQEYLKDIIGNLPLPNNPADPQGLILNATGYNNENQTLIRIDHQFSSKLSVFFRYLDDPFHLVVPNGFQATSLIPGVATSTMTNGSTNWLGHFSWVIGNNHVLEGGYATRTNWVTAHAIGYLNKANSPDINVSLPYTNGTQQVPSLIIGGSNYRVTEPYNERNPVSQIFLNNTNSIGRHTLKAGINLEFQQGGSNNGISNQGTFTFAPGVVPAGGTQFAQSFANFLLGRVATFTQSNIDPVGTNKTTILEGYVQDDFHASQRLSLSIGVRYSYYGTPIGAKLPGTYYTPVLNFDSAKFNPSQAPGLTKTGLICTSAPLCATGQSVNPNYNPLNGIIQGGLSSPYGDGASAVSTNDFAPRFGFTADVFGDGKTALRGGFGIFYYQVVGNNAKIPTIQDPPNSTTATISNTSFANPAGGTAAAAAPQGLQAFDATSRQPYSEQFSLDLQQQILPRTIFDIGYYGNHAVHTYAGVDINQPRAGAFTSVLSGPVTTANTQVLNLVRPYPGYSFITDQLNIFMARYSSLQTSLKHSLRDGTNITLNYTWAKSLTNASTPQDNTNIQQNYGPTPLSRRHVFNASVLYPIPFYRQQHGVLGHILGGYDLDAIIGYASGQFLTATQSGTDAGGLGLLVGPGAQRPDYVSNPNNNAPHTLAQWFNTAAFVPVQGARAGTETYSNIISPGYENWDLSLHKNILLERGVNFQLRAEAFNTFNHTNFVGVATVLGMTNFGQVTSAGPARSMQFGGKLTF